MSSTTSSSDLFSGATSSTSSIKGSSATPEQESRDTGPNDKSSKNRPKPMNACSMCRKRKIKCDGSTPTCGRCNRMKLECTYEEGRKKSGPRNGYVRGLQSRLAQAEDQLKKQATLASEPSIDSIPETFEPEPIHQFQHAEIEIQGSIQDESILSDALPEAQFMTTSSPEMFLPSFQGVEIDNFMSEEFSWAMIELGIQEPLPPQDTIDELTHTYFTKLHPSSPIIHQHRFLASLNLSLTSRPPISLRYAIWALAASILPKYASLHPHFHLRARKYAEIDETSGRQKYINIRHAQAWILIGIYEFKMMMFPHAWLTTGRATRLVQMLGLHRLDGLGVEVKQTLERETNVGEMEERRRTFWMAFCMDRYAGVGTGWPLIVDERDILTHLPSSEVAFEQNLLGPRIPLTQAMTPENAPLLSSFAGVALLASLAGQIQHHIQRSPINSNSQEQNSNSTYWKTHHSLSNTLLSLSQHLPSHLRLVTGSSSPNTIFLHTSLHCSLIVLHQVAILKLATHPFPDDELRESKARCLAAAQEIASIMKRIAHIDLSLLNIYTPFSIYVAIRIFAQTLKQQANSDAGNEDAESNMRFLLSALLAIRDSNPLVESYLIQLDLEGVGLAALQGNTLIISGFSDLEKGVAGMSVQEPRDEAEWITFVSPLVRIVEETEAGGSPEKEVGGTGDLKGKGRMDEEMVVEVGGSSGEGAEAGGSGWTDDLGVGIQEDPFNALMDFGRSR